MRMIDVMQALRKNDSVNAMQSLTNFPGRFYDLNQSESNIRCEKDLQEPRGEDSRDKYFLLQRHSQLPDARHRKYQDSKVRNDVENPSSLKEGIEIKAMALLHERIPDFLAWSTQTDVETDRDDIKDQVTPDADMYPDIDEHVALFGRCEDAKVLKQD